MSTEDGITVPVAAARLIVLLLPEVRRRRDLGPVGVEVVAALEGVLAQVRSTDYGGGGSAQVPQRPGDGWLTSMEYANHVGISDRAARKRCLNGTVRAARDRAGRWRIDPSEVSS